ncbi:MAG: hypothetical protein HYV14_12075 [Elusimicrobia bacterium]|nr:hypothetical protein [Elusimicrobiota bacterium]
MRRWIFQGLVFAVLGLFAFDCAQEVAGLCDTTEACQACFCGPHLAPQGVAEIAIAPVPAKYASYERSAYAYLPPSSIFRPPRLAA